MLGAIGAVVVAVLMVAAWIGAQQYSDRELERWHERYSAVLTTNLDRATNNLAKPEFAEDPMEPAPERSLAVAHPNLFSGLCALVAGVVGTVIVLLLSINQAVNRRS